MKITVIGSGYVGLVTGACLADVGHDVFCLDLDSQKIDLLNMGKVPIYEPGLDVLIQNNQRANRIKFSTDLKSAVDHGEVFFIAVGTPPGEDGSADLRYVLAAAESVATHMAGYKVIVDKSTVPVGTGDKVKERIQQVLKTRGVVLPFSVVSNPEFLKEGSAINDFMKPDRIVLGIHADESGDRAKDLMRQIYAPFNRNHDRTLLMDVRSAELTKYAANAMLATRISFMNELANLADQVGADIEMVRQGIGSDHRIGYSFLYAGAGYGGSCFPKDVKALVHTGIQSGQEMAILAAVEEVNQRQKIILTEKLLTYFKGDVRGKKIALWGLAFKPNTDDMREAPSRYIVKSLLEAGALVVAHDPIASHEALLTIQADLQSQVKLLNNFSIVEHPNDALNNADALLIATEWKIYQSPDFSKFKELMLAPVIFDGRNLYDPIFMKKHQIHYVGVGRAVYSMKDPVQ
jgi:UDPglucose 6-dehydrogenase